MRKTSLLLFMLLLLLCASARAADFSASGLTVGGSAQQLGKPDDFGSQKITVHVPEENRMTDGLSPLTGEPWSGRYQPILVNIDTHPRALPHWGVSSADIIYELPIWRDGSTRSLALFMTEYPDSAGPVRSARVPMASLREMWGGTYCFYGYQGGNDSNNVKNWAIANSSERRFAYPAYLNGITKHSQWFSRSRDHGHVAPYNVRLDINAVASNTSTSPAPHPFRFADEPLARGEDVDGVIISYKTGSNAYVSAYQYNDATGLYDRYRNGEPYIDGDTGEICSFANVLIIRTDVTWANGNSSRPIIRLHGQGVCEIFQSGRYIRGTWVRDCTETKRLKNRMVFLDENGEELLMQTGKTFIQIVDNEQPVVVLADSAISGAVAPQEQRLSIGSASAKSSKPRATRTPRPTRTPKPAETPAPEIPEFEEAPIVDFPMSGEDDPDGFDQNESHANDIHDDMEAAHTDGFPDTLPETDKTHAPDAEEEAGDSEESGLSKVPSSESGSDFSGETVKDPGSDAAQETTDDDAQKSAEDAEDASFEGEPQQTDAESAGNDSAAAEAPEIIAPDETENDPSSALSLSAATPGEAS